MTLLLLVGPLERPVNRGQGVRGIDERDAAQGEPVRHEAGKDVGAPLALALRLGDCDQRADTRERRGACFKSTK